MSAPKIRSEKASVLKLRSQKAKAETLKSKRSKKRRNKRTKALVKVQKSQVQRCHKIGCGS